MIYVDGKTGIAMGKRFNVTGITRDKEYDLTKGNAASKVMYFSANPNAEAEIVTVHLNPACSARNKVFDFYFEEIEIKARGAGGNQVTKYPVKSVKLKERGHSTLSAPKLYYDDAVGRLNKDGYGKYLVVSQKATASSPFTMMALTSSPILISATAMIWSG